MRITILGANSYIARNLIHYINVQGKDELFLYDYQEEHLDNAPNYQQLNILDAEKVQAVRLDVDIVYMFVGKTGTMQGFEDYSSYIDINEKALLNVLTAYRKSNSKAKIVFPSTRLVYHGVEGPLKEEAEKEYKTIYAINKYACEQYLKMYNAVFGVQYVTVRICVPYGTMIANASSYGTAEFMLSKAKEGADITLYGGGTVRRTLIHMLDLCAVLYLVGKTDQCKNDTYNIGGEDYSLKEMAEKIAVKYGIHVTDVPWPAAALKIESGDTVFDDTKLQRCINYQYQYSFDKWIEA